METISVRTNARTELIDITDKVVQVVKKSGVKDGLVYIYVPHTTAAVTINENADPSVQADILTELNKLIPFSDNYTHSEGNSAAHIKSSLIGASESVLVENGQLVFGTWQGLFFCEFDGPRSRKVYIKVMKDK